MNRRHSPRITTTAHANSSETPENTGTIGSDSTANLNLDLMPMPSGLRQQDFEFFLSALPDVPAATIYDTPARDEDFPTM